MFQEEFQGVEGGKKVILQILSEKGYARWSDFEKKLSKATVSRVLKVLEREGLVEKRGRYYVLVVKNYDVLIKTDYAPALCELIPNCTNSSKLAEDMVEVIGGDVLKIEEAYKQFMNVRLPSLIEEGVIGGLYALLLKALYQSKAFFTIVLMETVKLMLLKKLVDEGCNDVVVGLPEEYVKFLMRFIEENAEKASEFYGVKTEELFNTLMKLREVLVKHGYKGTIRLRTFLTTDVTLEIKELMMMMISMVFESVGQRGIAKCINTVFDISNNLLISGCRPLGVKEREALTKNCEDVVKLLIK